jgi:hypothetical protein
MDEPAAKGRGAKMASYLLCADHAFGSVIPAGTVVSDQPGTAGAQQIPVGWPPTPYADPLDAGGVANMYSAGVQLPGGSVPLKIVPKCRWVVDPNAGPGNPYRQFILSGPLAVGLPFQQLTGTRGQYP